MFSTERVVGGLTIIKFVFDVRERSSIKLVVSIRDDPSSVLVPVLILFAPISPPRISHWTLTISPFVTFKFLQEIFHLV